MNSVLEAPTAPQAETPAGETTKGKKAKKATAPSPETKPLLKRLDQSSTSSARRSSGRMPSAPSSRPP
jgi:hypothetical protein